MATTDNNPGESSTGAPADDLAGDPGDGPAQGTSTIAVNDGPQRGHVTVQRFWLVVIAGPDAGATFTSAGERTVIGTHESADFVLRDETVSRFHCEIALSGDKAVVRDLGSRNGTHLNGVSVLAAHVRDQSVLALGRTEIRFELRSDPVTVPLSEKERFGLMVGRSVQMRRVFALLERAAPSDAAVLLEGDTGTGKEIAAESIHAASARREGPFIVVDCGAIPPDLLESELFGHERGSFTGASQAREGAFEAASGGTIFLDEIGELGLELQPKLLRVLERKQVKRVGSNKYAAVDVRIVAATNRNLRQEVNERRFRSDLYYRLAVVEIRLPALHERRDDLPLLVEQLLESIGDPASPEAASLKTPEFLATLAAHRWPGNIRELRNYLERCLALRDRAPIGGDVPEPPLPDTSQPLKIARERWTRTLERRYVEELMRKHEGKVTVAARAAGIDRMYLYRLLWRYGLR
jgi:two-component system, NtrC family, response regulator GlrR